MNIGKAAEASGLPLKTIRYHETVANRRGNGYRHYAEDHVH